MVQATDDPADIGPCDFVLFCVKTFDTDAAAARLGPLLGDGTAVVSLQNGVENEEKLARAVGEDHVMGGAAFIFAGIAEPGVIVHSGGPASITFGELDGRATQRARRLLAWCERAGFQAELSANVKAVLWAKLAFICAQAGMTAAVRLPIGEIRTVDAAWAAFKRLVAEVCAVAEADGSPVPGAAQDSALALAQAIEPGSFSSLHDDLVAGRRMELEALHGFVVRRAAQHAVAVPTLEAVYAILQPWAIRNQQVAERADPRALPHIRARAEAASDVGEGLRRRDPAVCLDEFARTQPRGQGPGHMIANRLGYLVHATLDYPAHRYPSAATEGSGQLGSVIDASSSRKAIASAR